jgi:hypothetical protein
MLAINSEAAENLNPAERRSGLLFVQLFIGASTGKSGMLAGTGSPWRLGEAPRNELRDPDKVRVGLYLSSCA